MTLLESLKDKARKNPRRIVLAEGTERARAVAAEKMKEVRDAVRI